VRGRNVLSRLVPGRVADDDRQSRQRACALSQIRRSISGSRKER
jgi:hypothetical protein